MEGSVVCYTSFSYSYLSKARILVHSVRRVHPEWRIVAVIVDELPEDCKGFDELEEFDDVINAKDLGFPRFKSWLFKHDVVEACTAVKGRALVHLLNQGAEKVVYLDPDIAMFNPIGSILSRLEDSSIVLTPHQVDFNLEPSAISDNESTSMRYGVFNLGFLAVRNDDTGRAFARWWDSQLVRACYDRVEEGIFTDQKYCDLVPALFSGVYVERDPGCNVASWNLSKRNVTFSADGLGQLYSNNELLKFFHFTKLGSVGQSMTERYAGANTEVYEVWEWYKRMFRELSVPGVQSKYWHYANFADGSAIPKRLREFYRHRSDLSNFFDDPFETKDNSFLKWAEGEVPELLKQESKTVPT